MQILMNISNITQTKKVLYLSVYIVFLCFIEFMSNPWIPPNKTISNMYIRVDKKKNNETLFYKISGFKSPTIGDHSYPLLQIPFNHKGKLKT